MADSQLTLVNSGYSPPELEICLEKGSQVLQSRACNDEENFTINCNFKQMSTEAAKYIELSSQGKAYFADSSVDIDK